MTCRYAKLLLLVETETYHMIDRCDPEVATWSANGDNFVIKNLEKFASVSFLHKPEKLQS